MEEDCTSRRCGVGDDLVEAGREPCRVFPAALGVGDVDVAASRGRDGERPVELDAAAARDRARGRPRDDDGRVPVGPDVGARGARSVAEAVEHADGSAAGGTGVTVRACHTTARAEVRRRSGPDGARADVGHRVDPVVGAVDVQVLLANLVGLGELGGEHGRQLREDAALGEGDLGGERRVGELERRGAIGEPVPVVRRQVEQLEAVREVVLRDVHLVVLGGRERIEQRRGVRRSRVRVRVAEVRVGERGADRADCKSRDTADSRPVDSRRGSDDAAGDPSRFDDPPVTAVPRK